MSDPFPAPVRVAVLALAVARATRFVTTDKLGAWTVRLPLYDWALGHEEQMMLDTLSEEEQTKWTPLDPKEKVEHIAWARYLAKGQIRVPWRSKLVSGLTCPFCVGFWLTGAGLVALSVLRASGRSSRLAPFSWMIRLVGSALALNYVTGHLNSKID